MMIFRLWPLVLALALAGCAGVVNEEPENAPAWAGAINQERQTVGDIEMSDNTYNGWTNYQTWVVKLWLDNEYPGFEDEALEWLEMTESVTGLADAIENLHQENAPEVSGVYSDLMTHALGTVDWYEIAEAYAEDLGTVLDDGSWVSNDEDEEE